MLVSYPLETCGHEEFVGHYYRDVRVSVVELLMCLNSVLDERFAFEMDM